MLSIVEKQRFPSLKINSNKSIVRASRCSSSCGTSLDLPKAPTGRIQATAFRILLKLKPSKQAANKCFDMKNLPSGLLLFQVQFFILSSYLCLVLQPLLIQQRWVHSQTRSHSLDSHLFQIKGKRKRRHNSIVWTEHNGSFKRKKARIKHLFVLEECGR